MEQVSDPLSELIRLCAIRGSLDLRCQMAGPYHVDHAHSQPGEAVFHIILEGACHIRTAGTQLICHAGDLVLLPTGEAHQIICVTAQRNAPGWISRQPGLMVSVTPERPELDLICGRFNYQHTAGALLFDDLPALLHVPQVHMPEGFTRLIKADADARPPGATELVTALTSVMFIMAMRQHLQTAQLNPGMLALMRHRGLAAALVAVLRDPAAPWTIDRLAHCAHMSRATFLRRFSSATGRGPAEMLLDIRVHLAMRLLRDSSLPMSEVVDAVGYRSVAAFGRAFQRRTGITLAHARRKGQRSCNLEANNFCADEFFDSTTPARAEAHRRFTLN